MDQNNELYPGFYWIKIKALAPDRIGFWDGKKWWLSREEAIHSQPYAIGKHIAAPFARSYG